MKLLAFIAGFFITGFLQASVYKCASKEPESGLLYIAATRNSVNFHFTGNWGGHLSEPMTQLFIDELKVIPKGFFAHTFNFAIAKHNCEVATSGIAIRCKRSELIEPADLVVIDPHRTIVNFAMPVITHGEVYLKEKISSVGTKEYVLDLTLKTAFNQEGEIFEYMECVK